MNPDYENYYINHYFGKSLEEFIEKSKRGSAAIGKNNISIMAKINRYFEILVYFFIILFLIFFSFYLILSLLYFQNILFFLM
jgi:hypothetical protein